MVPFANASLATSDELQQGGGEGSWGGGGGGGRGRGEQGHAACWWRERRVNIVCLHRVMIPYLWQQYTLQYLLRWYSIFRGGGGGGGGGQHGMPETRHNTVFVAITQHLWP